MDLWKTSKIERASIAEKFFTRLHPTVQVFSHCTIVSPLTTGLWNDVKLLTVNGNVEIRIFDGDFHQIKNMPIVRQDARPEHFHSVVF